MKPAAKQDDNIIANDTHIVVTPNGARVVIPLPFVGVIDGALEPTVLIAGKPAAVHASTAMNTAVHIPVGGVFETPPSNRGSIVVGARTVLANHKLLARDGDAALTCNDPTDLVVGMVVATGTVLVGQ